MRGTHPSGRNAIIANKSECCYRASGGVRRMRNSCGGRRRTAVLQFKLGSLDGRSAAGQRLNSLTRRHVPHARLDQIKDMGAIAADHYVGVLADAGVVVPPARLVETLP